MAPYVHSLDTLSGVTNGSHKLTARARDAAGNIATSPQVTINVSNIVPDTILPTVTWVEPPANATISGAVQLSVTASDNIGVTNVMFFIDNIAFGSGSIGT